MSEIYYDLNVYLPGSVINLPVIDLYDGKQDNEEFKVERVERDRISASGYAGEIYHLVHLSSGEEVALKILGSGKLRKVIVALLSRLFLCWDFAWSLVEVKLATLNRVLLPKAVKQRAGQDLLVGSWRESYTFAKGKPALLLPWEDLRDARHGALSGVGSREIKERAKVARFLISFFKGIGADAFAWQFNHTRREPWGRWFIVLTIVCVVLTLWVTHSYNLFYDLKVNFLVVWCAFLSFAGASWFTANNLKKRLKDDSFCGPDLELGMPHIGICIPTTIAVVCCLLLLQKTLHLSNDWVLFLALVPFPGYLFLFEIPLFLYQLFCRGYPIPLSQLHIRDFAREFGSDRDFKDDIASYREFLTQFEAGRLNPINRLGVFLFVLFTSPYKKYILMYALLSFLGRGFRDKIVENWSVQGKVDSDFALRIKVMRLALLIGKKEKADLKILEVAVLLHDIGRKEEMKKKGKICHAKRSAEIAESILEKYNLEKEEKKNVIHCIATHRFRAGRKPKTLEAKVLYDADKIDSIGAVGIGRAFLFAGGAGSGNLYTGNEKQLARRDRDYSYTKEDSLFLEYEVKLKYIKDKMLTQEGKRLALKRHRFMQDYFKRFWLEIKGEK